MDNTGARCTCGCKLTYAEIRGYGLRVSLAKYALPKAAPDTGTYTFKYDTFFGPIKRAPTPRCECGAAKAHGSRDFAPGHTDYCPVRIK